MQDRRPRWAWTHKYAVPMFASSLVAVVLSGSGLVGAMVFFSGGDGSEEDGGGESGADSCVLGTWRAVSYTEDSEFGSAEMVEGEPIFTFEEDGTGRADFGTGTVMEAEVLGTEEQAAITGHITYRYETSGDTFAFVEQDSQAPFSSDLDIFGTGVEFTLPTGPLDYTCDGDELTITGEEQAFEYERADS